MAFNRSLFLIFLTHAHIVNDLITHTHTYFSSSADTIKHTDSFAGSQSSVEDTDRGELETGFVGKALALIDFFICFSSSRPDGSLWFRGESVLSEPGLLSCAASTQLLSLVYFECCLKVIQ